MSNNTLRPPSHDSNTKTFRLIVIILAVLLIVACVIFAVWVTHQNAAIRDMEEKLDELTASQGVEPPAPSAEPTPSEEPEITLLYINMLPQVVHVGDALPADDDYQFILTDADGNEVDISTIPGLEITPVCDAATDAPGTYTITATCTEVEGYEFRVLDNELVVLDESLTLIYINVGSASMTQGQKLPEFSYTLTDKDGNPYTRFFTQPEIEFICTADGTTTGTYPIDAQVTNEGEFPDFQFVVNKGALTVKAKPVISVTITMDSHTITAGDSKPVFTYRATDSSGNAITIPGLTVNTSCEATNTNTPGTYKITATVNKKDGYKFTVKDGTLTIKAKAPTPTPDPTPTPTQSHTKHTWGEWKVTKEADCTTSGERVHTCTYTGCGKTEAETISATGHSYGTDDSCTVCGTRNYDHTHSGGTATCTAKAVCSTCGEEYGKLAGHYYTDGICNICGEFDPVQSDPVQSDPVQSDPVQSDPVQSDPIDP